MPWPEASGRATLRCIERTPMEFEYPGGGGDVHLGHFAIMMFAGLVHGTLGLGFPMTATPPLAMLRTKATSRPSQ